MNSQAFYKTYLDEAISLLQSLVQAESFSGAEDKTAIILSEFLDSKEIEYKRYGNNVVARNEHFDPTRETILLNSHHDTVKPNSGYTKDPFEPSIEDGKLFGLGSNDAGGSLVSLIQTFGHFYAEENLPYNIILAATAEEENSGPGGIESILDQLAPVSFAIVGEPTEMKMAVAEKGLLVLDCLSKGKSGHAARDLGVNAIYEAMQDIDWFKNYQFEEVSEYLGPVKMSVTMINSGYQHNVIPDTCSFVVDVRTTDAYSNEEVLETVKNNVRCEVSPRSTRLSPSSISTEMDIVKVAKKLGIEQFGSPTTSDQALMSFPSLKMGPGKSERSHTADEFIWLEEIESGIVGYIQLLEELFKQKQSES